MVKRGESGESGEWLRVVESGERGVESGSDHVCDSVINDSLCSKLVVHIATR